MNTKVKGYIVGAVAAATYGTNPLFALPLYEEGMSPAAVLFYRYLFALPAVGLMLALRRHSFAVARRDVGLVMLMGVMMSVSSLTLFESYNYMDAGIASTLLFVYPLMVAVIMAIIFGERLTVATVGCLAMALCGIALLFKGGDGATLSVAGTALVMASSLTYAVYIVGVNRPRLRQIPTLKIVFYGLLCGVVIFGAKIGVSSGDSFAGPSDWYMWGCVVALALLPTLMSFVCTTMAIQSIGPTPTAILGALEPVTAVFFGVTVFGEVLTARDWVGLVLIVLAVSLVVGGGKISGALVRFRRLFPRLRRRG